MDGRTEIYQFHILGRSATDKSLRPVRERLADRHRHILSYGKPGKQRVILEDNAPLMAGSPHGFSFEQHVTLSRLDQAVDQVHQGRFPASRKAYDGYEFPFLDLQVDVRQYFGSLGAAPIGLTDIF